MDVFKAWPGRAESIVISQESYMGCTGGVAPWRRDGDTGPSYYAVCPLCDNPIQIVGLFRRQEESRARRPYGRHHRGDVPGLGRDDGQQAFDDLTLDVDQDWLSHTADAQPGRDGRLLDIARETLR